VKAASRLLPGAFWMARGAVAASLALSAAACGSSGAADRSPSIPGATPTPAAAGWTLVWSDEFEGPSGALVDAGKWVFDVGGSGWGNQELESYTDRPRNASLNGEGALAIQALRETYAGPDGVSRQYTSARLKTQGRFEQAYGRFEARLKIPRGQGLWPAFWMLGDDIGSSGWPRCGEIDVMENIGREPKTVHGTIHGPGYSGGGGIGSPFTLPGGALVADDFHVFAVEWEPAAIRWYVDGTLYQTRTPADLPAGQRWVFDHPFFLLLNVAVGGSWPGSPDANTVFPQVMLVDYVRVYRRQP
jgi:beta-glucanase (GH16 family)